MMLASPGGSLLARSSSASLLIALAVVVFSILLSPEIVSAGGPEGTGGDAEAASEGGAGHGFGQSSITSAADADQSGPSTNNDHGNGDDPPGNGGTTGNGDDPPGNGGANGNGGDTGRGDDPPGNRGITGQGANPPGANPPGAEAPGSQADPPGRAVGADPPGAAVGREPGPPSWAGAGGRSQWGRGRGGILPLVLSSGLGGPDEPLADPAARSTNTEVRAAIQDRVSLIPAVPRPREIEAPEVLQVLVASIPADVPVLPLSAAASLLVVVGGMSLQGAPLWSGGVLRGLLAILSA